MNRINYFLFLSLLGLPSLALSSPSRMCRPLFSEEYELKVSAFLSSYNNAFRQMTRRSENLMLSETAYNREVRNFFFGITKNQLIVDSGGGFSVYGLNWAKAKKAKIITISLDDFIGQHVLRSSDDPSIIEFQNTTTDFNSTIDALAQALLIENPRDSLITRVHKVATEIRALQGLGLFKRIQGRTQDVLDTMDPNSIDKFIDFNGAFYYSNQKVNLLKQMYHTLKPGGQALIWMVDADAFLLKTADGSYIPLFQILQELVPNSIKQIENDAGGRGVIITKPLQNGSTLPEILNRFNLESLGRSLSEIHTYYEKYVLRSN